MHHPTPAPVALLAMVVVLFQFLLIHHINASPIIHTFDQQFERGRWNIHQTLYLTKVKHDQIKAATILQTLHVFLDPIQGTAEALRTDSVACRKADYLPKERHPFRFLSSAASFNPLNTSMLDDPETTGNKASIHHKEERPRSGSLSRRRLNATGLAPGPAPGPAPGTCPKGYDGTQCENKVPCTTGTNDQPCENDGNPTGFVSDDSCSCICKENSFAGLHCEIQILYDCDVSYTMRWDSAFELYTRWTNATCWRQS